MKTNFLNDGERLDDLELDDLMIIQKVSGYRFSTDSVLLANFISAKSSDYYIDLCSGSGVVAILATHKNRIKKTIAVEIQTEYADMARRSSDYNKMNIEVMNCNLSDVPSLLGFEVADVISVNPPYNPVGAKSQNTEIAVSTHEVLTNLEKIAQCVGRLLKFGGKLFMIHRADRLVDIFQELRKNKIEPKQIRIVYPKANKEPNLVLVEGKKGAKPGLKILKPLVLVNDDGSETEELKTIYGRK